MRQRAKPWLGPIVLAVLALCAAVFAQSAAGQSLLRSAGLVTKAQPFTELAFERPGKLPHRLTGGKPATTDFRIHNDEGKTHRYAWIVEQHREDGSGKRTLRSGNTTLAAGLTSVVRAPIRPLCDARRVRIEVRLSRPAQSIGYWVRCDPPTSAPAP